MSAKMDDSVDLPTEIPIFSLPSALFCTAAPLNIFEPRYLAMVDDALGQPERLIGMVQPMEEQGGLFGIGALAVSAISRKPRMGVI